MKLLYWKERSEFTYFKLDRDGNQPFNTILVEEPFNLVKLINECGYSVDNPINFGDGFHKYPDDSYRLSVYHIQYMGNIIGKGVDLLLALNDLATNLYHVQFMLDVLTDNKKELSNLIYDIENEEFEEIDISSDFNDNFDKQCYILFETISVYDIPYILQQCGYDLHRADKHDFFEKKFRETNRIPWYFYTVYHLEKTEGKYEQKYFYGWGSNIASVLNLILINYRGRGYNHQKSMDALY